jgi:hypothetical protein
VGSVTFDGSQFLVVNGDRFALDRSALFPLGIAQKTTLPNSDGAVYAIRNVDPGLVLAIFDGHGAQLLVEANLLRGLPTDGSAGAEPLAAAVPGLCSYYRAPIPAACPGTQ